MRRCFSSLAMRPPNRVGFRYAIAVQSEQSRPSDLSNSSDPQLGRWSRRRSAAFRSRAPRQTPGRATVPTSLRATLVLPAVLSGLSFAVFSAPEIAGPVQCPSNGSARASIDARNRSVGAPRPRTGKFLRPAMAQLRQTSTQQKTRHAWGSLRLQSKTDAKFDRESPSIRF